MFGHSLSGKKSESQFFTFEPFYKKKPLYKKRDEGYRKDVRRYIKQALEGMKVYRKIDYKTSPDIYKWGLKAVFEDLYYAKKFYDSILLDHPENEAVRLSYEKAWAKFEKLKRLIQSSLPVYAKKLDKPSRPLCIDIPITTRKNDQMITGVVPVFISAGKITNLHMFNTFHHVAKEEKLDLVQFRKDIKLRSDLVVSLLLDLKDAEVILNLMAVNYKMLSPLVLVHFVLFKQRLIKVIENNLQSSSSFMINQRVVVALEQGSTFIPAQANISFRHDLLNDIFIILDRLQDFLTQLIVNYKVFDKDDLSLFEFCKKEVCASVVSGLKAPDPLLATNNTLESEGDLVSLKLK